MEKVICFHGAQVYICCLSTAEIRGAPKCFHFFFKKFCGTFEVAPWNFDQSKSHAMPSILEFVRQPSQNMHNFLKGF